MTDCPLPDILTPRHDGTLFWRERRTLFVADPHLGKADAFQAAGIPVPQQTTPHDLRRLSDALRETEAERLVILGDLLHAQSSRTDEVFDAIAGWRDDNEHVDVLLIRGNHDRNAGDLPDDLRITHHEPGLEAPPFRYTHEPEPQPHELVTLCGHIHPAVRLRESSGQSIRIACFWFDAKRNTVVLPAFGRFTGTAVIRPAETDRVFLITPDGVLQAT